MKLDVSFYRAKNDKECGPTALKMVLSFFDEDYSIEELAKFERQLESGLVWTAGIVRASKKLGFPTKLVSTKNFNHEHDNIDYYKNYVGEEGVSILKNLLKEIKELDTEIEEKDLQLSELLDYITINSVPIVLIDWNILANKPDFSGHFVPLTGYDKENVYFHNPGIASAGPHIKIKKERFLKAWESKGTNKDTIIIFRK